MDKLKPCPFCGSEAYAYGIPSRKHIFVDMPDYGGVGFVECTNCTAAVAESSLENAIEAWNRRDEN